MDSLWNNVLAEIEKQISRPVFLTFFKPSRLISHDRNVAIIVSPTDIGAEYLEKRFYPLIKKGLDKYIGKEVTLVFRSEEHKN